MNNFVIGLDLGQSQDYSAVAVVEKLPQTAKEEVTRQGRRGIVTVEKPPIFHCRHLERYALGTLYPEIVNQVHGMVQEPQLRGASLVVDATGVGRPVVDLFTQRGLKPVPVVITGGDTVTRDGKYWRVPKRDLVGAVQAPLQAGRVKFAETMPLTETLIQEMLHFRVRISDSGHDSYSHREGAHDDLVLAVMLALWWETRQRPQARVGGSGSVSMRTLT